MPRRVRLPAADDLFRTTDSEVHEAHQAAEAPEPARVRAVPDPEPSRPSGRVKHDEKMTVYVTSAELMDIEQARLRLRGELGLAVDRGRLVREAVALVLADLHAHGEDSALVRRLGEP